jgi:NADH-quinone oxidoreductase subunit L
MIAALGIGAYTAAVFHLVMHAFFKALLFLGSGSVIHGMEHGKMHSGEQIDPQDMRNMGGLRRKMSTTFWTFLVGGLALSGFPLVTAGFWSKDEILSGAFSGGHTAVFVTLAVSALLTAFYTARQITLVFLGQPRSKSASHAHESKPVMTLPLVVLGFFAVAAGWAGIPHAFPVLGKFSSAWFQSFVGTMSSIEPVEGHSLIPLVVSLLVSLGGLALGWLVYRKQTMSEEQDPLQKAFGPAFTVLKNKYYIDEFYEVAFIKPWQWVGEHIVYQFLDLTVIDGLLHGIARLGLWIGSKLRYWFDLPVVNGAGDQLARGTRGAGTILSKLQTGKVQQYMLITLAFIVVSVILLFFFLA